MESHEFIGFCDPDVSLPVCAFMQLDNPDEQAAQIRRELDGRLQMADHIARVRKLGGHCWGTRPKSHTGNKLLIKVHERKKQRSREEGR